MATATAFLKNYRQSPRKVRAVAGLIRGKSVARALDQLGFTAKRASNPLQKLLLSAVANARQINMNIDALVVKEIRVDGGLVMKRMMPRARGRGAQILKRTSHVLIAVTDDAENPVAKRIAAKSAKIAAKSEAKVADKSSKVKTNK